MTDISYLGEGHILDVNGEKKLMSMDVSGMEFKPIYYRESEKNQFFSLLNEGLVISKINDSLYNVYMSVTFVFALSEPNKEGLQGLIDKIQEWMPVHRLVSIEANPSKVSKSYWMNADVAFVVGYHRAITVEIFLEQIRT